MLHNTQTIHSHFAAAGYHRYSASWMGGNEAGIHSFVGLHAAMCGKQQQCPQVQPCAPAPKCPVCPAQPLCAPQPCMPPGQQQQQQQLAAQAGGAAGNGAAASGSSGSSSGSDGGSAPSIPKPLSALRVRGELGPLLEREKLQVGAELGVKVGWPAWIAGVLQCFFGGVLCAQQCCPPANVSHTLALILRPLVSQSTRSALQAGAFSEQLLRAWPSCTRMYLVDVWGQQANYKDAANVADAQQVRWCSAGASRRISVRSYSLHSTVSWCVRHHERQQDGWLGRPVCSTLCLASFPPCRRPFTRRRAGGCSPGRTRCAPAAAKRALLLPQLACLKALPSEAACPA